MPRPPVLIVGAGPCGLAAALELRRHEIAVRILDSAIRPREGSRSILVWPPLLALLEDNGLLVEAYDRGIRLRTMTYYGDHGQLARVSFPERHAPLVLPQQHLDGLLEAALERKGVTVERSLRVESVAAAGQEVLVSAKNADMRQSALRVSWLIAADGSRSTVRDQLRIAFARTPLPARVLLAEGRLVNRGTTTDITYAFTRHGVLLVAPLPEGLVRIAGDIGSGVTPTEDTVQELVDVRAASRLRVAEITSLSVFTAEEGIASELRRGHCFLVGDAAHTHSPMGGQGANLGIQDARNLAWKLAGVLKGALAPAILDTYDPERRATAIRAVRLTGMLSRASILRPPWDRLRNGMIRIGHACGALNRWYPPLLAGEQIRYPATPLGCPARSSLAKWCFPMHLIGGPAPAWVGRHSDAGPGQYRIVSVGPSCETDMTSRARLLAESMPELLAHHHVTSTSSRK